MQEWTTAAQREWGITPDTEVPGLLDLSRDFGQLILRPIAPLTALLRGLLPRPSRGPATA